MSHPEPQKFSALERVPDEILRDIFMHIAMDSPWRDESGFPTYFPVHPLMRVIQVNRRFNAVASPLMVRDWRLSLTDHNGARFVLHLLRQPHLRSQVRRLDLDVVNFDDVWHNGDAARGTRWPRSVISTAEVEQLVESAGKACPPLAGMRFDEGEVSWLGQIGRRSPGAISALVVAWATELQELDLSLDLGNVDEPDPWLFQLVKVAAGVLSPPGGQGHGLPSPSMFTRLRCVTLGHWLVPMWDRNVSLISSDDEDPTMDGTHAAPFFRLPGLRVFKAYSMDAAGLTLDEADQSGTGTALQPPADKLFPNGTSHVEENHLYRSHISENGVRVLTRACKRLRVLILQWDNNLLPIRGFNFFGNAILEAIKLHFASLEEISIGITEDTLVESYGDVEPGAFGDCLLRCDKLVRLTINPEVLYGDENYEKNSSSHPLSAVLPAGLTSLSLGLGTVSHGAELQATKDNVLGLLRECGPKGWFSRLKTLQLIDCTMEADEKQDFMGLARKAGVALTLSDPVDTDEPSTTASVGSP